MSRLVRGALIAVTFVAIGAPVGEAAAREYKLVLSPEPGQEPPARVCLVSRSRAMRSDRGQGPVGALADRAQCVGRTCTARRDTRPARCQTCPETPHDGCKAQLDLGDYTVDDFSVVCADDDTAPAEGGTIYVVVESVEAESPPAFYSLEVSGGRVRWSPVNRISRPSYRVLGGDYDASRLSYPRVPSDQPWAEVPVTRRCRCLDVQLAAGMSAPQLIKFGGAPVCHGAMGQAGLVPVEVPAVARNAGTGVLGVSSLEADVHARWSSRWPDVPVTVVPHRFDFGWRMPCMWPRGDKCPDVVLSGAQCTTPGPQDGICRYRCSVITDQVLRLPAEMNLVLDDPVVDVPTVLGGIGHTEVGRMPPEQRVVWSDVSTWKYDTPGDRIRAVEVLGVDGSKVTIELSAQEGDRLLVPLPGAQCNTSLRVRPIGERAYEAGFAPTRRGAQVKLPEPADQAVLYDLVPGVGVGVGYIRAPVENDTVINAYSLLFTGRIGLRLRPPGHRWAGQVREVLVYFADWPYKPVYAPDMDEEVKSHHYFIYLTELSVDYAFLLGSRSLVVHAGGGAGVGIDPFGDAEALVESGVLVGTGSLGATLPVSAELTGRSAARLELRYIGGARMLRYHGNNLEGRVLRESAPVHTLLLTMGIDFRL